MKKQLEITERNSMCSEEYLKSLKENWDLEAKFIDGAIQVESFEMIRRIAQQTKDRENDSPNSANRQLIRRMEQRAEDLGHVLNM